MFCHITENWRRRPLVSHEAVVNLIGNTTTKGGLEIQAELDEGSYPTGQEVTEAQLATLAIERDKFPWRVELHVVSQALINDLFWLES